MVDTHIPDILPYNGVMAEIKELSTVRYLKLACFQDQLISRQLTYSGYPEETHSDPTRV